MTQSIELDAETLEKALLQSLDRVLFLLATQKKRLRRKAKQ